MYIFFVNLKVKDNNSGNVSSIENWTGRKNAWLCLIQLKMGEKITQNYLSFEYKNKDSNTKKCCYTYGL